MSAPPGPAVQLLRCMQWWSLWSAAAQLAGDDMGLPPPPALRADDIHSVCLWLWECAEIVGEPIG